MALWSIGRFEDVTMGREAGHRGWIIHFVLKDRTIAQGPTAGAAFEADVKTTMYQAGWEASYICYSQGGTFDSCNDPASRQFQADLGEAVKTMDRIVKQSGYAPTPAAQKALAVLQNVVAYARAERLQAR
jgi:hypothetical protein